LNKLFLKSGRERSLINRHPWVFSGAVKQLPEATNGEIIEVCTNNGVLLGYGFFSPDSQITCRVFEFCDSSTSIDSHYWFTKLESAVNWRNRIINPVDTNIFRLIHAEGDFFPGLIVDVYAQVAVVQILTKGVELISAIIFDSLQKLGYKYIYIKTKQNTQFLEGVFEGNRWLTESFPMPLEAMENSIRFLVDVEKGQKTGFFIDQRENRRILATYSKGKKVLNTFSYTGGFSLYALDAGAEIVHSVDSSKDAIEMGDKNIELSGFSGRHQSFAIDCFDFLKNCDDDYDIIVLDPPAFAKNARSVDNATRGYKNLNLQGIKKVKPGGLIFTFSCSQHIDKDLFRKVVFSAAADAKRNVRIIKQLSQPEDHPINIYHPEGEYLKGLLLEVE